ncbi:hypothetical protein D2C89_00970 [Helicobacter pylori]|nr:hypothetical protein D2C89_00970 [Helicobacter pylori]QEE98667.1 hypothetical protein D2C88_04585 [Helicobacter pylori]
MQNSLPKLIIKHLLRFAFSYETPCDDLKSERIIFLKSKRIETNQIFDWFGGFATLKKLQYKKLDKLSLVLESLTKIKIAVILKKQYEIKEFVCNSVI